MQRTVLTSLLLVGTLVVSLAAQPPTQPRQPFLPFGQPKQPAFAGNEKDPTPEQVSFFEKNIRPVLVEKCIGCHSKEDNKLRGGLALDTREGLRKGGESGPILVAGSPEKSLLIKSIQHVGELKMPPAKKVGEDPVKLEAHVIANFEKWIKDGAADPRVGKVVVKAMDLEKGRQHWAFQPIQARTVPATKTPAWVWSDVDAFVLAALETNKLQPAADATSRVLVRRLYFDLIGLPPTPEQVEAFAVESDRDRRKAIAKLVDTLLESPAYGERWGRHWLDVARYAESSGKDRNVVYPFAWRYRDYVLASFNADKPYDQFIREQIAGDLLTVKDDAQKAEFLIATGYLAVGAKAHGANNPREFKLDVADEQIDAVGQGMLALTIACARCHDHKFDPIPQKDYYALSGIFTSSDTRFGGATSQQIRQASDLVSLPSVASLPDGNKRTATQLEDLKKRLETTKTDLDKAVEEARKNAGNGMLNIRPIILRGQVNTLTKTLGYYDDKGDPKKLSMGMAESFRVGDSPVYERGEVGKPGATVARGFPQVLSTGKEPRIGRSGSGRKELADWIASADNPLTSRVIVNRVWLHLFGSGIVDTPDNFGTMGTAPSHPELLDHLAKKFTTEGWSIKKLIKSLVLTRAYQMASDTAHAQQAVDPDNRWFWRQSKKRLEAEPLRDAILAVSGLLDRTPAVASPLAMSLDGIIGGPGGGFGMRPGLFGGQPPMNVKRSVYLQVVRDQPGEFLQLFDFADANNVTGQRSSTTVPTQALFLMNSPFVQQASDAFANKLSGDGDEAKLSHAFTLAFGREPRQSEVATAKKFAAKYPSRSKSEVWTVFCQSLLASAEFRTID